MFVKRYAWKDNGAYPDYGCNTEVYTAAAFIEVETLGPLTTLAPGATAEHTERWSLHKGITLGRDRGRRREGDSGAGRTGEVTGCRAITSSRRDSAVTAVETAAAVTGPLFDAGFDESRALSTLR